MTDTTHPDVHDPTTARGRCSVPIVHSIPIVGRDHLAAGRPQAGPAEGGQ